MKYSNNALGLIEWNLEIDLVSDIQAILALYQYFNLQKRIVACKTRKVHKSKEFNCPQGYDEALENFEKKVEKGESLIPFLSDKLLDASYSDGILNDWNIYHFHLTKRFRDDGWAKRSNYELFAYVTDTDMYFLQVYEHKDKLLYWHKELVKIINDNRPELLDDFHLKEIVGLSEKLDDEGYKELREAHITTFVELGENQVFGMIGGGYMSDGSSGEAMRISDFWSNHLRMIQEILVANMDKLCEIIGTVVESDSKEYKIKLLWIDNDKEITFCESTRHVIIQLNMNKGYWRICQPFEVFSNINIMEVFRRASYVSSMSKFEI